MSLYQLADEIDKDLETLKEKVPNFPSYASEDLKGAINNLDDKVERLRNIRECIEQPIVGASSGSVPGHIVETIKRYNEDRIRPGSFTTAVLYNDLELALAKADPISKRRLEDIVRYIIENVPAARRGSREKVETYLFRETKVPGGADA